MKTKTVKHFKWCYCQGPRPYFWFEGSRVCEECEGFIDNPSVEQWKKMNKKGDN